MLACVVFDWLFWVLRHLRLEGSEKFHKQSFSSFSVLVKRLENYSSIVSKFDAILAKFHKPFFSNFSVLAMVFEAFAAAGFLADAPAKFHQQSFSNFFVLAKRLDFEAFASRKFSCKCQSPASKFDTRSLQKFLSHF